MPEMGMYTSDMPNGRVDLMSPVVQPGWVQQVAQQGANRSFHREALYGRIQRTPVSDMFFSAQNIDILQNAIRYKVHQTTGVTVGRQSDQELKVIMTSMFFRYARHVANDITGQVREINSKVLDYAVDQVVNNLKQYLTYRRDASTMPMPLDHAKLMTTKGLKQLEIKSFFGKE